MTEVNVLEIYSQDEKLEKADVDALKDWIAKQPHLPKLSGKLF